MGQRGRNRLKENTSQEHGQYAHLTVSTTISGGPAPLMNALQHELAYCRVLTSGEVEATLFFTDGRLRLHWLLSHLRLNGYLMHYLKRNPGKWLGALWWYLSSLSRATATKVLRHLQAASVQEDIVSKKCTRSSNRKPKKLISPLKSSCWCAGALGGTHLRCPLVRAKSRKGR